MKKTLFFSNIVGDICSKDSDDIRFNNYMENYLQENIINNANLIFINAPGLGGEENYLNNIIKCFEKIGIIFDDILDIEIDTNKETIDNFITKKDNIVIFLMGGNPYIQKDIIDKNELNDFIKNYKGLVIGFCAGAINLSKYSIITTDEDFEIKDSYKGLGRENIIIEPHYNSELDINRNEEIEYFSKKYNNSIYALPDESIIYFEDGKKYIKGKYKVFN